MSNNTSPESFFKYATLIAVIIIIGVNMYRGITVKKLGIPGVFEMEFGGAQETNGSKDPGHPTPQQQPQPQQPQPQQPTQQQPQQQNPIDYSGKWKTNKPGLEYIINQTENQITWTIPNGPSGPGKIDKTGIHPNVGGQYIHFFIAERDANGKPIKLRTNNPAYSDLILSR